MASDRERSRSPRASSNEDIYGLIVQREQARLAKDWQLADSIRDSLTAAGVTLFDKTNAWRSADGRSGRIPTFSEIEAGQTGESLLAQQQDNLTPLAGQAGGSSENEAHFRHLVQMREQARASKDFAQSDQIRDQLKELGVEVFDKDKMWRAKTGESGCIIGYRGTQGATDLEINTLVIQREKARQSSDFATADKIRDELKQAGVDIMDKEKIWRSQDGRTGAVPTWSQIMGGGAEAMPTTTIGAMPTATLGAIPGLAGLGQALGQDQLRNQIIQAALAAAQNPATAGRTLQLLQQVGGLAAQPQVQVPIMPQAPARHMGVQVAGARPISPEAQEALNFITQCKAAGRPVADAEIEWLVSTREKLRQNKDFASADEMRNSLRSQLGVELYEKEKRWQSQDGRQGTIPSWDKLA